MAEKNGSDAQEARIRRINTKMKTKSNVIIIHSSYRTEHAVDLNCSRTTLNINRGLFKISYWDAIRSETSCFWVHNDDHLTVLMAFVSNIMELAEGDLMANSREKITDPSSTTQTLIEPHGLIQV